MPGNLRIGIIGCGIAGQAAAIALTRDGHHVTLVERFAQAQPLGAGLLLQPSGLDALGALGLREAALGWGAPVARLDGRTKGGRKVLDLDYCGTQGLGIHRAALFNILRDGVARTDTKIVLGFDVQEIAGTTLIARDGREEGPFDLVLDCAGAHDVLRKDLGMRFHDPVYPWGALWTTCPDRTGKFNGALRQVYDGAGLMIGILPVGRAPGSAFDGGHVAFFWSLRHSDFETQKRAGLDALKARVLAAWPEAAPIVAEIAHFDALSLATYRDVRVCPSYRGNVLVMGDAAHGTSPQLGQGANLALIDAVSIAYALRKSADVPSALKRYENMRRAHLRYYQLASRALTPAFQSGSRVIGWARDAFMGPSRWVPGAGYFMRTTLAGIRKFPFGIWRLPK